MSAAENKSVSILNWLGTLILYAIPVVNILVLILTIIFAKSDSKRKFAIAGLILMVVLVLAIVAAFLFFPEQLVQFAEWLDATAASLQA